MRGRIYRFSGQRGTSWRYIVDLPADPATGVRRQRRASGFRTRKEAEAALALALADADAGDVRTDARTLTVGAYLTDWLAANKAPTLSPTTWHGYEHIVRQRIVPRIGAVRLSALTPKILQSLYADLAATEGERAGGLGPQSLRNTYTFVNRTLNDAVRLRLLKENPNRLVARPRVPKADTDFWSPSDAAEFLAQTADDRLWPAWILLLSTGMRRGELVGLRWKDLDLDGLRLVVRQNVVAAGYEVHAKEPKTAGSRRTVALDELTVEALRRHRRRIEDEAAIVGRTVKDDERVLVDELGQPFHPQSISYYFQKAAERCGIRPISIRDARHTSATLALLAKTHPKVVSERVGHSGIRITMDTYTHVLENLQHEAAANIAAMLRRPT